MYKVETQVFSGATSCWPIVPEVPKDHSVINSIPVLDCLTLKMKALHFFETMVNYLLVNMV